MDLDGLELVDAILLPQGPDLEEQRLPLESFCVAVCPVLSLMASACGQNILIIPIGSVLDNLRAVARGRKGGPYYYCHRTIIGARPSLDSYLLPFTFSFCDTYDDSDSEGSGIVHDYVG
jgi:hypothetical protein